MSQGKQQESGRKQIAPDRAEDSRDQGVRGRVRGRLRRGMRIALSLPVLLILFVCGAVLYVTAMPGKSPGGVLPPLTAEERKAREGVERHVRALAGEIGPRSMEVSGSLERSLRYLESELGAMGYKPRRESYRVRGEEVSNLVVEIPGREAGGPVVLAGAHYDTVPESPGADDNASGCAALLEVARAWSTGEEGRTTRPVPRLPVRLVFFVNEEYPYAGGPEMGSFVHAQGCRRRGEHLAAMLSLESIGYYSDAPESQKYPSPAFDVLYPTTANFVAILGDLASRPLVHRVMALFRAHATLPSEGAALPREMAGVGRSDHRSFWMHGYQGVMATGTAPFRNPNYHAAGDTPDTLDYDRLARAAVGLRRAIGDLAEAR